MNPEKIGLMGGTFDPIHNGHLFIAGEAADICGLSCVYFIPAAVPPHRKEKPSSSVEDRYNMALLAVEGDPRFIVSSAELERGGASYTIDTVRDFGRKFPGRERLCFIIGFDSYLEFDSWKQANALLNECVFATAPRHLEDRLLMRGDLREGFIKLDIPALEISSTDIRNRVESGRSIKYLVPAPVEKFIIEHNLYSPRDE